MDQAVYETQIQSLPLVHRGKVRDIYAVGDDHLLMIATDRISAFDVILPTPVPGKGKILTQMSKFWFGYMGELISNHLAAMELDEVLTDPAEYAQAHGRSMLVKRLNAQPIEAVVRGYITGSGWVDYQQSGQVCGITLPNGLQQAQKLDAPIFTPARKAEVGDHDENISYAQAAELVGEPLMSQIKEISIELYQRASAHAAKCGILLADTKFEFGIDEQGNLILMDEIFTPDSSRFWPAEQWQLGSSPPSYDKQFVRDYLLTLKDWDRQAPGPELPAEVIEQTRGIYLQALEELTGSKELP